MPGPSLLLASLLLAATPAAPDAKAPATAPIAFGSLVGTRPAEWVEEKPTSAMRKAQLRLPRAAGDADDATLVVFHFGPMAGSVDANLDRWLSQMAQPDGKPSREKARIERGESAGMKRTILDVSGRYVAEAMPGGGDRMDKPGWRMVAAVVEAKDGAFYVKVVGPQKTVAAHEKGIRAFLDSLKPGK